MLYNLNAKDIEEYKELVKRETGIELTNEEAEKQAMSLIRLAEIVYKNS